MRITTFEAKMEVSPSPLCLLQRRVDELENRLAAVSIRADLAWRQHNSSSSRVSLGDLVSGIAFAVICIGGLFLAWLACGQ